MLLLLSVGKWKSLSHVWLYATPFHTVYEILQARILEWVAIPFSRGSSQPKDRTQVSCIAGGFFTTCWATREAHCLQGVMSKSNVSWIFPAIFWEFYSLAIYIRYTVFIELIFVRNVKSLSRFSFVFWHHLLERLSFLYWIPFFKKCIYKN